MLFNVTSPCAHCPFRKDVRGYLHPERAADIARQMQEDDCAWFACHETTTSKGRTIRNKKAAMCAGLMVLQQRIGRPNVAMRIAAAAHILDLGALLTKEKLRITFTSFKQFVNHHKRAWRR